jgi:pyridoxal phosphate enzyme (YggS family)
LSVSSDGAKEVTERLAQVRERIQAAAAQARRDPGSVRLIAVSKLQPVEKIRAAYAAGQRDFGENYAQELLQKRAELADLSELRFHMIGHVQTNKVAKLVTAVSAIHTVGSPRLAAELGKRAQPIAAERRVSGDERLAVFIEVNVSREPQKSGCAPEALAELIERVRAEPALALVGLMTVPAPGHGEQLAELALLREQHGGAAALPELSIGMSDDFELAISAYGSTVVRIGTAIFGGRR